MINSIIAEHKYDECPVQDDFKMHAHNLYEILYFIDGDAMYSVEGNIYSLKKGDVILIRKGETHHVVFKSQMPYERYVVQFDPSDLITSGEYKYIMRLFDERPLGQNNRFYGKNLPSSQWLYYIKKIYEHQNSTERQQIYTLALLSELADTVGDNIEAYSKGEKNNINEILNYINSNISLPLSLEDIEEKFFLSKSQINRKFKTTLGTTPWNYIRIKRIYKAREYILQGYTPGEAATKSGYTDYVSFYKLYKKEFGISPKANNSDKAKKSR